MSIRHLMLVVLVVSASAFGSQPVPENILRDVGFDQKLNADVPLTLVFRDESGISAPLRDFFPSNKPTILVLGYNGCPMLCTAVLNGLTSCLRMISLDAGADYSIVFVSIDPSESPQLAAKKKAEYLHSYRRPGSADGWHFLTGDDSSIRALAQSVGYRFIYDFTARQYVHPSGIVLVTPSGKVSKYFLGIDFSARDLRLALVEASQNSIGTLTDQILLFCYRYDPATGKYGFAVITAIRLGGIATVLALATFIFVSLRRERRMKLVPAELTMRGPP